MISPSSAANGPLARALSSLHLSTPPLPAPTSPPLPALPLSPSSSSDSVIILTPPSPLALSPTLESPIDHPPAPPSSPTEPEGRGRQRSRSPPPSPSLGLGRLRISPTATSGTRPIRLPPRDSRARSRSPRRGPFPARHRSRSPPADLQLSPSRPSSSSPQPTDENALIRTCEGSQSPTSGYDSSASTSTHEQLSGSEYSEDVEREWVAMVKWTRRTLETEEGVETTENVRWTLAMHEWPLETDSEDSGYDPDPENESGDPMDLDGPNEEETL